MNAEMEEELGLAPVHPQAVADQPDHFDNGPLPDEQDNPLAEDTSFDAWRPGEPGRIIRHDGTVAQQGDWATDTWQEDCRYEYPEETSASAECSDWETQYGKEYYYKFGYQYATPEPKYGTEASPEACPAEASSQNNQTAAQNPTAESSSGSPVWQDECHDGYDYGYWSEYTDQGPTIYPDGQQPDSDTERHLDDAEDHIEQYDNSADYTDYGQFGQYGDEGDWRYEQQMGSYEAMGDEFPDDSEEHFGSQANQDDEDFEADMADDSTDEIEDDSADQIDAEEGGQFDAEMTETMQEEPAADSMPSQQQSAAQPDNAARHHGWYEAAGQTAVSQYPYEYQQKWQDAPSCQYGYDPRSNFEHEDGAEWEYGFESEYGPSYTREYGFKAGYGDQAENGYEAYGWSASRPSDALPHASPDAAQERSEFAPAAQSADEFQPAQPQPQMGTNVMQQRDWEAEVAADWAASQYEDAWAAHADQGFESSHEQEAYPHHHVSNPESTSSADSPAAESEGYWYSGTGVEEQYPFDTPLEGEPGELRPSSYDPAPGSRTEGQPAAEEPSGQAASTAGTEGYQYVDPYQYYGYDYYRDDLYRGTTDDSPAPSTTESAQPETSSAIMPQTGESGLELFAWHPTQLLTTADQELLRTLESLADEPAGVRRATLNDYVESLGLEAIEFANHFEDSSDSEVLALADDLPGAAALLGVFRLYEQGELGLDEATHLLDRSLRSLSLDWIEGVHEITANGYTSDQAPTQDAIEAPAGVEDQGMDGAGFDADYPEYFEGGLGGFEGASTVHPVVEGLLVSALRLASGMGGPIWEVSGQVLAMARDTSLTP